MAPPPPSLTKEIIGCFYEVYRTLGYGHLDKVTTRALVAELGRVGLRPEREVVYRVAYKGTPAGTYRADLIVDGSVVVETKAGARLDPGSKPQLLNYLKACGLELGLVLYFG